MSIPKSNSSFFSQPKPLLPIRNGYAICDKPTPFAEPTLEAITESDWYGLIDCFPEIPHEALIFVDGNQLISLKIGSSETRHEVPTAGK